MVDNLENVSVASSDYTFPSGNDTLRHYVKIDIYDYKRNDGIQSLADEFVSNTSLAVSTFLSDVSSIIPGLNEAESQFSATSNTTIQSKINTTKKKYSIKLPIPVQIKDSESVHLNEQSLFDSLTQIGSTNSNGNSSVAGGLLQGVFGGIKIGSDIVGAASPYLGISINKFVNVAVNSPAFKEYSYTWRLSPKNSADSKAIRDIIKIIRNSARMSISSGASYFQYPRIFKLSIMTANAENKYFFEFKPAIVHSLTVSYSDGADGIGFYRDDGAPNFVDLTLQFKEVEYFLREDS